MLTARKTNTDLAKLKENLVHYFKYLIIIACFLIIALNIGIFLNKNINLYTKPFNADYYKNLYGQSQYVLVTPLSVIPDEYVYSHAAWEYITGANPAVFNADQPPLGKYFIGLSEMYLGNEKLTGPIFNILALIALFFLSNAVLKSWTWAALLTAVFSFEKLFIVQMLYAPLLDNIQIFFIILSFIAYIGSFKNSKLLIVAFLLLGCVMSVKFWATGIVIYLIWLLDQVYHRNLQSIFRFVCSTPLIVISMILVYIPSFWQGDSLRNFFGVQRYIYEFHKGKLDINPTSIWDLLLFNRWHVPWEGVIKPSVDWQLTWPIITILSVVALLAALIPVLFRKRIPSLQINREVRLMILWFICYFVLLSIGSVLARYIIPVLPAMYILSFWVIKNIFSNIFLIKLKNKLVDLK